MPSSADVQARFQALKSEIQKLGFVRPGSLVRRFMPCGNPTCRCMADPPQLHGPYYQWSQKVAGRTRSIRLSEEQARLCQQWTQNHKRLKKLVHQLERLSLKETDRILGA